MLVPLNPPLPYECDNDFCCRPSKCGQFFGWIFNLCKSKKNPNHVQEVVKRHISHSPEPSGDAFTDLRKPFLERDVVQLENHGAATLKSKLKEVVHSNVFKGITLTASVVNLIVWVQISNDTGIILSGLFVGYCGQSCAKSIGHNINKTLKGKKIAYLVDKIYRHSSLPLLMLTGFYRSHNWAVILNSALGGVFINNFKEHVFSSHGNHAHDIEMEQISDANQLTFYQRHRSKLVMSFLGLSLLSYGSVKILSNRQIIEQNESNGNLSGALVAVEYGIKGISFVAAQMIEPFIHQKSKTSENWSIAYKSFDAMYSFGSGLALYEHEILSSNIGRMLTNIPVGFFLGLTLTQQNRFYEKRKEMEQGMILKKETTAKVTHVVTLLGFAAFAWYFKVYETEETAGLYALFISTPATYLIARFCFPPKAPGVEMLKIRELGHILFHNCPQLPSEEITYWLTFVERGLIKRSELHAAYFQAAQGVLLGSSQAALLALTQRENELSSENGDNDAVEEAIGANVGPQSRTDMWVRWLLHKTRA